MTSLEIESFGVDEVESLNAGLDSLTAEGPKKSSEANWINRIISAGTPSFIAIALLLLVWGGIYYIKIKPSYVLPSPINVWHSVETLLHQGVLWSAVGNSLRRAAFGFLASVIVGTLLGLSLVRFRYLRLGIGPLVSGLQSLPSVAWVPAARTRLMSERSRPV